MAYMRDTYTYHDEGSLASMASGIVLLFAVTLLAASIAGLALFMAQP